MRRNRVTSLAVIAAVTSLAVGSAVSAQSPAAVSMAPAGSSDMKIGLVTDVGTLDDRNFNQYSCEGAVEGAAAGSARPNPRTPSASQSTDIGKNIQAFVDEGYDIIVTVGFAAGTDTAIAAKANPDIKFIGVDQAFICIDPEGMPDADVRRATATRPPCCRTSASTGTRSSPAISRASSQRPSARPVISPPSAAPASCLRCRTTSSAIRMAPSR